MKRKILFFLFFSSLLIPATHTSSNENLDSAEKLFHAQEYKKAVNHLKKVTQKDPSNTRAWLLLGDSYRGLGKQKKAIKAYEKALRIDASHKDALFGLGISYANLRKHPQAIAVLKHLVEIDPSNAKAHRAEEAQIL